MMAADPAAWMIYSKMKLPNGQEFSFTNHEYQLEWYQTLHKKICYMKATGGGVSECEIWKSNHGLRYGRYPQGVAYWFPTNDDMLDYSKTRFGPIYKLNYDAIGKYMKSGGKGATDSAAVKRICNSNLYLRGARLAPMGEGDTKISTKTSGIHVDRNVLDEVDQFDPDSLSKIEGRLGHSEIAETVYIANPSDEDYGIDLIWQQCDQRHWFRKCCNKWQCAELDFPDIPIKYKDGRGYIACKVCGGRLPIWNGEGTAEWRPMKEGARITGWRWSHLTSIFHDPADILDKFNNPPQGNLADVYRLDLGLPYSSKEDKLRREDVLACCGLDSQADSALGPCAMGVDNDMRKHVVIGIRTGQDRFEVLKVAVCKDFEEVHDLARKFNVRSTVCDRKPNIDAAMQFQKNEGPIGNRTWLCEYSDTLLAETQWNDNTQIVRVHRTGCFDGSHRIITRGAVRLPRQSPQLEEFARQCCNVARFKEKDKKSGIDVFRYRTTGGDKADHFRNAFNYFTLAAGNNRICVVNERFRGSSEPKYVVNDMGRYI
jgi:hypothetical protein